MNNLVRVSFLVFISFATVISCSSSSYDSLTEELVRSVISALDDATENKDATIFSDALSDDVKIVITMNFQGQSQVVRPSKQEYIAMLEEGWSMYENYKYRKSNVKIKIQGSKAFVSADVRESMTVQGQNIAGESKEEITIELINGKPLITNMVGYTSM